MVNNVALNHFCCSAAVAVDQLASECPWQAQRCRRPLRSLLLAPSASVAGPRVLLSAVDGAAAVSNVRDNIASQHWSIALAGSCYGRISQEHSPRRVRLRAFSAALKTVYSGTCNLHCGAARKSRDIYRTQQSRPRRRRDLSVTFALRDQHCSRSEGAPPCISSCGCSPAYLDMISTCGHCKSCFYILAGPFLQKNYLPCPRQKPSGLGSVEMAALLHPRTVMVLLQNDSKNLICSSVGASPHSG